MLTKSFSSACPSLFSVEKDRLYRRLRRRQGSWGDAWNEAHSIRSSSGEEAKEGGEREEEKERVKKSLFWFPPSLFPLSLSLFHSPFLSHCSLSLPIKFPTHPPLRKERDGYRDLRGGEMVERTNGDNGRGQANKSGVRLLC